MDFARPYEESPSVVSCSGIRYIPKDEMKELFAKKDTDRDESTSKNNDNNADEGKDADENLDSLNEMLIHAANESAISLFQPSQSSSPSSKDTTTIPQFIDGKLYPEFTTSRSSSIEEGSLIVIFESFDNLNFVYAKKGEIFNNRNGHFYHDDFLGKPFGSKIRSRNNEGYGYVYLLRPTPELWARSLNHRTQIVFELDASTVICMLNLRPNMIVCESGTGSGAMSHCILRTIAPKGTLHTFEFNEARVKAAREEFKKNQVDHLVHVHHRDVCGKENGKGGFGKIWGFEGDESTGTEENIVDAVFLDLPEPWLAVGHAKRVMKGNARIASYSPCVEQSQRVIQAMKKEGFHMIKTIEVRLREYYVDSVTYEMPPTFKLQDREESATWNYTMTANQNSSEEESSKDNKNKRKKNEETADDENEKKAKVGKTVQETKEGKKKEPINCARPFPTMRGHTAFLTFATSPLK